MISTLAALGAASLFLVIAGFHIYWALGGLWPGYDSESLAQIVVGSPPGISAPGPGPCWSVAILLLAAMGIVLSAAGVFALPIAPRLLHRLAVVVVLILFVRGLGGFAFPLIRPAKGSPFVRLNMIMYSPLCLILAVLSLVAVQY